MKYFPKIDGERLYLSPVNADDAEIYVKWLNDKEVASNLDYYAQILTIQKEKEWLSAEHDNHILAIVLKDKDRLIGNVSLNNIDHVNQTAELGIFIGERDDRNKGYGREAIKLILNYGFNTLNLNNIMLKVYSFNENAIRTYKKVGFKPFGTRRKSCYRDGIFYDVIYMDILKHEFNEIEDFIFIP